MICGPDGVDRYAADPSTPVLACALLPLGLRFREELPTGVFDFGADVWSQPDSFIPWDPPEPGDLALPGCSQQDLLSPQPFVVPGLEPGGRLLTTENPASPSGLPGFVEPLVSRGSTIWVRNPDVTGGQPARS